MALLEVKNLSFSYSKKSVLENVSFTIEPSSVTVILGANGAGKSTLIKILAGIYKYQGDIFYQDVNVKEIKKKTYASYVSYVPQSPSFVSSTVVDAILLGRLPLFTAPSKKDYQRVYEVIEELGLEDFAMKDVTKLSGGEQQKVALARAFVGESTITLLDEPTANLDLKNCFETIKTLKKSAANGKSIVLSMHDVNDALDVGDRFIVLKDNGVLAEGDVSVLTAELLSEVYGLDFHKVEHDGKIHFHFKEDQK
ncbi:MAG: ABC transporter ATP-binding protein [Clostridia bacterium]|nr:ABC transporter ATP-binding protein [Clostridia bacterium]